MGLKMMTAAEQREASKAAVRVRRHRSEAKAALRAGDFPLSEFIDTSDEALRGIRVGDALRALKTGDLVAIALRALDLRPNATFRSLGEHQRERLLKAAEED